MAWDAPLPVTSLERIRALYLTFALALLAVGAFSAAPLGSGGLVVSAALAGVGAWLVVGHRRAAFPLAGDVLAALALTAAGLAVRDAGAVVAAPVGYVMVRSAFGTGWPDVIGSVLPIAAFALAGVAALLPPFGEASRWSGLAVLAGVAIMALFVLVNQTLARSLVRERAVRERFLELSKMQAVGRLAAGIAHDFNNLLTAVRGHAEFILTDVPRGSETAEDAEAIVSAVERGQRMVARLLAYAKRQRLTPAPVSVDGVVRQMQPLLRQLLGEDVRVSHDLDDGGPAMVDRTQLEQVILALAANARDAMPGGGWMRIRTRREGTRGVVREVPPELAPGDYVVLAVRDTGRGMDATTRERAFEPFFSGHRPGEAAGMGLAIVHGIVAQSGGAVTLDSAPGRGSLFEVWLPAAPPVPTAEVEALGSAGSPWPASTDSPDADP